MRSDHRAIASSARAHRSAAGEPELRWVRLRPDEDGPYRHPRGRLSLWCPARPFKRIAYAVEFCDGWQPYVGDEERDLRPARHGRRPRANSAYSGGISGIDLLTAVEVARATVNFY